MTEQQLQQSAELYLVYAADLRRLPAIGNRWRFYLLWDDSKVKLDQRVNGELSDEGIKSFGSSRLEEIADRFS